MATSPLQEHIDKRYQQVNDHLALIGLIEKAQSGQLDKTPQLKVSVAQINILQSTVYLMLYNMVESTMSEINRHLSSRLTAASLTAKQVPDPLLREWLRHEAKTHEREGISEDGQLETITKLFNAHTHGEAVVFTKFKPMVGTNWAEQAIYAFLNGQLGIPMPDELVVTKNNPTTLKTILDKRNGLAHGWLSFTDALTPGSTSGQLKTMAEQAYTTLTVIVAKVEAYLEDTIPTSSGEEAT